MARGLTGADAPVVGGRPLVTNAAAVVCVRPLVLIAVAVGADERRGRPRALVVGLGARRAVPPAVDRIGHGLAGLVASEVLLVLRVRPAGNLAAPAARIRLDRVLDGPALAALRAVIRTIGQVRAAAGGAAAAGGVRGPRDHDLIDGAGVEGAVAAGEIPVDLAPHGGVGDVGRRRGAVEPVRGARAQVGELDARVLRDGVVLAGGAELVAEIPQRRGVPVVRAAARERRTPEDEDQPGRGEHAAAVIGQGAGLA